MHAAKLNPIPLVDWDSQSFNASTRNNFAVKLESTKCGPSSAICKGIQWIFKSVGKEVVKGIIHSNHYGGSGES